MRTLGLLRCVQSQKSSHPTDIAAQAWNQDDYFLSYINPYTGPSYFRSSNSTLSAYRNNLKKRRVIIIIIISYHLHAGIHNCIPQTKYGSQAYSASAILWLQFIVHVMQFRMLNVSYFYISTFRRKCTVPSMAVLSSYLLLLLLLLFLFTFMHGIYKYIPETNRVSQVHIVVTLLYL